MREKQVTPLASAVKKMWTKIPLRHRLFSFRDNHRLIHSRKHALSYMRAWETDSLDKTHRGRLDMVRYLERSVVSQENRFTTYANRGWAESFAVSLCRRSLTSLYAEILACEESDRKDELKTEIARIEAEIIEIEKSRPKNMTSFFWESVDHL